MNRRKAIKMLLLGGAAATTLVSYKWLDRIKATDAAYLADKQALLAELAETIIPATDSPGAKEVGVGTFIFRMLRDCADARSLSNFIIGLQELEEYCLTYFRQTFIHCTPQQREAVLREFECRAVFFKGILGKVERKLMGQPFFTLLKTYTVMGFCTSQLGATRALKYESIPGRYENISPVPASYRSWATK